MKSVFVTRVLPGNFVDKLSKELDVEVYEKDGVISREELLRRIQGKDGVITLLNDKVDKEFFDAAGGGLKVVANYAVGYDNIDVEEATKRKVAITNTPGVLTESVAEYTWALILAVVRRVVEADSFTRKGNYRGWAPGMFLGMQLEGKTMGIVGLGRIGRWVAQRASRGFEMKVVYHNRSRDEKLEKEYGVSYKSLDELLKLADVVSLHVPLTKETKHLIGEKELKEMKETAYLVNTARGAVIDEAALVRALKAGLIAGAGMDVFEFEPKITKELMKLSNVVLTPHIASATVEAREEMAHLAASSIRAVLMGNKPANLINDNIWSRRG